MGLLSVLLANVGIAAMGALLGSLAQGHAGRESLLSIICFPLLVPLLLAAIRIGALALTPDPLSGAENGWIGILAAFAAIFIGAGLILFPFLYGDE
jgi:heme exporter protein B